ARFPYDHVVLREFVENVTPVDSVAGSYFREILTVAGIKWHEVIEAQNPASGGEFRNLNVLALLDRLNDPNTVFDATIGDCDKTTINEASKAVCELVDDIYEFSRLHDGVAEDVKSVCGMLEVLDANLINPSGFKGGNWYNLTLTMQRLLSKRLIPMVHELMELDFEPEYAGGRWASIGEDLTAFYRFWYGAYSLQYDGYVFNFYRVKKGQYPG